MNFFDQFKKSINLQSEDNYSPGPQENKKENPVEKEIRDLFPNETEGMKLARDYSCIKYPVEGIDVWYSYGINNAQYHFYQSGNTWEAKEYSPLEARIFLFKNGGKPVFSDNSGRRIKQSLLAEYNEALENADENRQAALVELKTKAFEEITNAGIDLSDKDEETIFKYVDDLARTSHNNQQFGAKKWIFKNGLTFTVAGYLISTDFLYCLILANLKGRHSFAEKHLIQDFDFTPYEKIVKESGSGYKIYEDLHEDADGQIGRIYDIFNHKTYDAVAELDYIDKETSHEPETEWYKTVLKEVNH